MIASYLCRPARVCQFGPCGDEAFHSSSGLDWPLDGLTLQAGMRTGTSNRVTEGLVTLKAADGDGYMVIAPVDCFAAMLAAAAFK